MKCKSAAWCVYVMVMNKNCWQWWGTDCISSWFCITGVRTAGRGRQCHTSSDQCAHWSETVEIAWYWRQDTPHHFDVVSIEKSNILETWQALSSMWPFWSSVSGLLCMGYQSWPLLPIPTFQVQLQLFPFPQSNVCELTYFHENLVVKFLAVFWVFFLVLFLSVGQFDLIKKWNYCDLYFNSQVRMFQQWI